MSFEFDIRSLSGIPQTDIIVKECIRKGLDDFRKYPILLDFVFKNLYTNLLVKKYGNTELNKIKKWFVSNNIPVVDSNYRFDKPTFPVISVGRVRSDEAKDMASLGDTDPEIEEEFLPEESYFYTPEPTSQTFSAVSYDLESGVMVLPDNISTDTIFPGQGVLGQSGTNYQILSVAQNSITIAPNVRDNFSEARIMSAYRKVKVKYNFLYLRETFEINCYTQNSVAENFWLSSIVRYILAKYRKEIFECNNINVSSMQMSSAVMEELFEATSVMVLRQPIVMDFVTECRIATDVSKLIEGISPLEVNIVEPPVESGDQINLIDDRDESIAETLIIR